MLRVILMICSLTICMLCKCDSSFAQTLPSTLYIHVTSDKLHFIVTDPLGKRTGFDSLANQTFNENAPNAGYQEINDTGDPVDNVNEFINNQATDGIYKIRVVGSALIKYSIAIDYPMPSKMPNIYKKGITDINKIDNYEFTYNYAQGLTGTRLSLVKVSTPNDLIADITTAQKLNLIGNAKFVTELTKEINEIEAEKAKGKIDDGLTPIQKAKKEYAELLKEITEKYNKPESDEFVKQEAYTVLKEDLEYIISHL